MPKEIKRRACALLQWDRNLPKLTLVRHVMKTKVPERWRNYLNPVGVCVRVLLSCSPCSCTFLLLLFCFCCVIFPFAWSWCLECCFCFWLCFHFPATSSEVHQDSGGDILRAQLFSWLKHRYIIMRDKKQKLKQECLLEFYIKVQTRKRLRRPLI